MVALAFSLTSMWGFLSSPLRENTESHTRLLREPPDCRPIAWQQIRRLALKETSGLGELTALTCELGSCRDKLSPD